MPGWNPSSRVDGREVGSESSKVRGSPYKGARGATVTFFRGGRVRFAVRLMPKPPGYFVR